MRKKLVLAGITAAMLAGCGDDGVDAPMYVKNAQEKLEYQLESFSGIALPCYRQQFEQRWFILCFDRDKPVISPKPLYEIAEAKNSVYGYMIKPVNGKASQYGDNFEPNYADVTYVDMYAPKVNIDAVFDLFRKTYPPKS